MAQIERHQARIHRICAQNFASKKLEKEAVVISPDVHHCIGKSQNEPEHTGLFVQKHSGNPAVKVFSSTR
jgi:hypothetical protein